MNLYIYKYNNYYNRMVKYENSLEDYGEPIHRLVGCKDFSPNDYVNTTHIFGSSVNNYDGGGDYLIVLDDNQEILSRWFIIETTFISSRAQWKLQLRRDLVVDYYEDIIEAPCFIEKANLDSYNPLIFNSENMTYNQIKTNETLLKDKSNCPWLVGYYSKKGGSDFKGAVAANDLIDTPYIQITEPIESWEFYKYQTEDFVTDMTNIQWYVRGIEGNTLKRVVIKINQPGIYDTWSVASNASTLGFSLNAAVLGPYLAESFKPYSTTLFNQLEDFFVNYNDVSTKNELFSYQGALVRDINGKFFRISVTQSAPQAKFENVTAGALYETLSSVVNSNEYVYGTPNAASFMVGASFSTYRIGISEEEVFKTTYDLTGEKLITDDAPWNIFAIPYGEITVKNITNETILNTSKDIAIQTAMSMQVNHGSFIYDIQLLPYCPIPELITEEGVLTFTNEKQYSFIKNNANNTNIGIIFNVPKSRFTFNITDVVIPQGVSSIERKVNSECNKYRLASPNYSNYFDFNAEKNNGVQYFNVDCDYKPFSPYIHINPNFSGLYGNDYNDPRGLVLGGDFSISQVVDEWVQYQIQNKNFQSIFDRQIQNMEIQNNIGRTQDIVSTIAGTAQGATSGGFAGSLSGSGVGTVIGAGIGTAFSLGGGIADIAINETLRNENLDYTKDLFGYQLGNIQALPQTISKVSALNNNNKLFPVLEYYTCKPTEKRALIDKVAWNGMTVMTIGKISDYLGKTWSYEYVNELAEMFTINSQNYIKGKIIRIESINDEYHLLKEISNEINKGVYF